MTTLKLTVYPAGHPIRWRRGIVQRVGTRRGMLACDWLEHSAAFVLWDGEIEPHPEYPECIEVRPLASEPQPMRASAAVGNPNAWAEYGQRRRV
jgi:hypothetical protein